MFELMWRHDLLDNMAVDTSWASLAFGWRRDAPGGRFLGGNPGNGDVDRAAAGVGVVHWHLQRGALLKRIEPVARAPGPVERGDEGTAVAGGETLSGVARPRSAAETVSQATRKLPLCFMRTSLAGSAGRSHPVNPLCW